MKGTQSIERAIQLLRLFNDEQPDWTLQELIFETGLTKTTVFRMLSTLKDEGFLDQSESGQWCLGSELIMLGGRSMRRHRVRSIAGKFMRKVARVTGESVTLDILWVDDHNCPYSMVIDEALGHHLLGMTQYVGSQLPAHATSTGKALLAYQPEDVLNTFNLNELASLTDDTIRTKTDLLEELKQVKAQGFGMTVHELEVGIMGIAVPIFNHHNEIVAALSAAGPASRLPIKKLTSFAPILKEAAGDISYKIGFRPETENHPPLNKDTTHEKTQPF
ncbi:MAG: IclR family transcriptional regulator [Chloroflexota bacterium]